MPFASIDPTHPRTNSWNFGENCSAFGGGWKTQFFLSRPFWNFFRFFFLYSLWDTKDGTKFWWLPWFPENSKNLNQISVLRACFWMWNWIFSCQKLSYMLYMGVNWQFRKGCFMPEWQLCIYSSPYLNTLESPTLLVTVHLKFGFFIIYEPSR